MTKAKDKRPSNVVPRFKGANVLNATLIARISATLLEDIEVLAYKRGFTASGLARWMLEREVLAARAEIDDARAELGLVAPAQAGLALGK